MRFNKIKTKKEEEDNTNKIKEKKENDSEINIRKDDTQHKNKGSFEEFIESEKKIRARYKNIDKKLDVNLPNPITQTINLLLKINENVTLKEEFETFQLINYYN